MADLPKEAEEEARTLDELRKINAQLKRELKQRPTEVKTDAAAIIEARRTGERSGQEQVQAATATIKSLQATIKRLRDAMETLMKFVININAQDFTSGCDVDPALLTKIIESSIAQATKLIDSKLEVRNRSFLAVQKEGQKLIEKLSALMNAEVAVEVTVGRQAPFKIEAASAKQNGNAIAKQGHNNVSEGLKPVEQRVLDALAEAEQLSASNPDRSLLALLSGYTHIQSTGFVKALGALRTAGHIDYPSGGTVCLTDSGRVWANMPDRPTTPEELQQRVCDLIGGAATKVLQPLIDAYPKALTRQALAEAAGYGHIQSTGFVKVLGRLNTLGFTEAPRGTGTVVAKPVLFLE